MKIIWTVIFILLMVFSVSVERISEILNDADLEMQRLDFMVPHLSSDPREVRPWKSYNQWYCFVSRKVKLRCRDYDDGEIIVPSLLIEFPSFRYEFDVPIEDGFNCKRTLHEWSKLISDNVEVCIYAAFMPGITEPDYPTDWGLWYLETIKTKSGYWSIYDSDNPKLIHLLKN